MVPFAGWEMPVQYEGVIPEHIAVREDCGAFDVSHMGQIDVEGPRARELLDSLLSNDLGRIGSGRAQYTLLTNERGGIVEARIPLKNSEEFRWTPELAPSGPVSIIISTKDQTVVVLRNGTEIGRARAVVNQAASDSQVLTLARNMHGKNEWIQVGVNNLKAEDAAIISTQGVERMQLPAPFVVRMREVMAPGTTVLITSASVDADSTGVQTTVIASDR